MPRKSEPTERHCIVTRDVRPTDQLIRFVLDPEGRVVPDLRHKLPGRGVWITASRPHIETAERKKLFGRAFKENAAVEPGLADRIEAQLRAAALSALSLARKAGGLVTGFAKVEAAVAGGQAVALIHAGDAGADGVRKLEQATRRSNRSDLPAIGTFSAADLSLALGGAHVIHAALLAGRASDFVLHEIAALARFNDREPHPILDDRTTADTRSSAETFDLAAGHDNA